MQPSVDGFSCLNCPQNSTSSPGMPCNSSLVCQNGGTLNFNPIANINACICPSGFNGTTCGNSRRGTTSTINDLQLGLGLGLGLGISLVLTILGLCFFGFKHWNKKGVILNQIPWIPSPKGFFHNSPFTYHYISFLIHNYFI